MGFKDGPLQEALFNDPSGITTDPRENVLYVADSLNNRIRKIDLKNNQVTTLTGHGWRVCSGSMGMHFKLVTGLCVDTKTGDLFVSCSSCIMLISLKHYNVIFTVGASDRPSGWADGHSVEARFDAIEQICYDAVTEMLYVADMMNHCIRCVDKKTQMVTTCAGLSSRCTDTPSGHQDGEAKFALFWRPIGICLDSSCTSLFISDCRNHVIRRISGLQRYEETMPQPIEKFVQISSKPCKECVEALGYKLKYFKDILSGSEKCLNERSETAPNPYKLTKDEIFALILCTFELGENYPKEDNFYYVLNHDLGTKTDLDKWSGYLYYFRSALAKIPAWVGDVFLIIQHTPYIQNNYYPHRKIIWSHYTPTSTNVQIAKQFATATDMILCLKIFNGKDIRYYSYLPIKNEILLHSNMELVVRTDFFTIDTTKCVDLLQVNDNKFVW